MNDSMEFDLVTMKTTRSHLAAVLDGLEEPQIHEIPMGFRNNILWNAGHIVVSQQLLCYKLSGLPMQIDDSLVAIFRRGSSPVDWKTQPSLSDIEKYILESPLKLEQDFRAGTFGQYQPYKTSFGVTLTSIEEAIRFNNVHEGMHLGYILALCKLVT
jgi:hypothetical protein